MRAVCACGAPAFTALVSAAALEYAFNHATHQRRSPLRARSRERGKEWEVSHMSQASRRRAVTLSGGLFGVALLLAAVSWPSYGSAAAGLKRSPAPGVTFEIVELKRIDAKAVGLIYEVKNDTHKKINLNQFGVRGLMGTGFAAKLVGLVDFKNGKRYGVGSAGSNCLCSEGDLTVPPGGDMKFWAQFAAPPADVDKIAVMIGNVPPFYDVPIQK
jgi:hypothetical protein